MKTKKVGTRKAKKQNYHHQNLRAALLKAAITFLKKGRAEDISLRNLARQLKVSHMAPYRHFKTKEDLLMALIADGFENLSLSFDKTFLEMKDLPFPKLFAQLGLTYVQFVIQNPEQSRLMFSGLLCDKAKHTKTHEAGQGTFERLTRLIQLGQANGILRQEDPHLMALMIWSTVHGVSMLMIEKQFEMIDDAPEIKTAPLLDYISGQLLKGLS